MMSDRDRMWLTAHDLIEGLGKHFGMWKGPALSVAYKSIMNDLTDEEIKLILETLKRDLHA